MIDVDRAVVFVVHCDSLSEYNYEKRKNMCIITSYANTTLYYIWIDHSVIQSNRVTQCPIKWNQNETIDKI